MLTICIHIRSVTKHCHHSNIRIHIKNFATSFSYLFIILFIYKYFMKKNQLIVLWCFIIDTPIYLYVIDVDKKEIRWSPVVPLALLDVALEAATNSHVLYTISINVTICCRLHLLIYHNTQCIRCRLSFLL